LCIRAIMNVNIISLERFDERLGHAVQLRRSHRREAGNEADRLGEGDGVVGAVTATVIREPLHRMRGLLIVKTSLDALEHEIAIISPEMPPVVAFQDITSRSQVSSAKATRTL